MMSHVSCGLPCDEPCLLWPASWWAMSHVACLVMSHVSCNLSHDEPCLMYLASQKRLSGLLYCVICIINCSVQVNFLSLKNIYKTRARLIWQTFISVVYQWNGTPNDRYIPLTVDCCKHFQLKLVFGEHILTNLHQLVWNNKTLIQIKYYINAMLYTISNSWYIDCKPLLEHPSNLLQLIFHNLYQLIHGRRLLFLIFNKSNKNNHSKNNLSLLARLCEWRFMKKVIHINCRHTDGWLGQCKISKSSCSVGS